MLLQDCNKRGRKRESSSVSVDADDNVDDGSQPPQKDTHLVTAHGKNCFWCWRENASANFEQRVSGQEPNQEPNTVQEPTHAETPMDSLMDMDPTFAEEGPARSDSDSFSFMMDIDHDLLPLPHNDLLPPPRTNGLPGICRPGDIPPILFRWYNDDSQGINKRELIRAGSFAHEDSIDLDTSNLTTEEFLSFFTDHVTKEKISSPFISTCLLPMTPVQRALKYQKNAMVAIIDTSKLDTVIVKASELVPLTGTRTPRWRGFGEYLIWKEASEAAIICTFSLSHMEQIAKDSEDIGELLQLDCIRAHHQSGKDLYIQIATNTRTLRRPRITFERLMFHLGVPQAQESLVIDKFEEAWSMDRRWIRDGGSEEGDGHRDSHMALAYDYCEHGSYVHAGESASQGDGQLQGHPHHTPGRFEFKGEIQPDFEYRPSERHESDSSTSEEESGSEPIVRCPREDTPSEGCFTLRDDDDDEDEPELRAFSQETVSLRDVELFTPSEPSLSRRSYRLHVTPIPLDFNRGDTPYRAASRPPSEAENADGTEIIEVD